MEGHPDCRPVHPDRPPGLADVPLRDGQHPEHHLDVRPVHRHRHGRGRRHRRPGERDDAPGAGRETQGGRRPRHRRGGYLRHRLHPHDAVRVPPADDDLRHGRHHVPPAGLDRVHHHDRVHDRRPHPRPHAVLAAPHDREQERQAVPLHLRPGEPLPGRRVPRIRPDDRLVHEPQEARDAVRGRHFRRRHRHLRPPDEDRVLPDGGPGPHPGVRGTAHRHGAGRHPRPGAAPVREDRRRRARDQGPELQLRPGRFPERLRVHAQQRHLPDLDEHQHRVDGRPQALHLRDRRPHPRGPQALPGNQQVHRHRRRHGHGRPQLRPAGDLRL